MKRILCVICSLFFYNSYAQRMNVQTIDDSIKSFDLSKINSISFFVNDTLPLSDPKATMTITISGNLNSDNGPNFGDIDPGTSEFLPKNWLVEDNSGNHGNIFIQYIKTGIDTWAWTAINDIGGSFSENTGILSIDNYGYIINSMTTGGASSFTFTPVYNGSGGANAVTIMLPIEGINIFQTPTIFAYYVSAGGAADVFRPSFLPDYYAIVGIIYDSQGAKHFITIRFEKVTPIGGVDTWIWSVFSVTNTNQTATPPFQGSGTIQFNALGKFMNMATNIPIRVVPNNSANIINIAILDFHTMTQYEGRSFGSLQQDGSPALK